MDDEREGSKLTRKLRFLQPDSGLAKVASVGQCEQRHFWILAARGTGKASGFRAFGDLLLAACKLTHVLSGKNGSEWMRRASNGMHKKKIELFCSPGRAAD